MLQAISLHCDRSRRQLFTALDISVAPGQLLQVRGPNGSGKTTLLKILVGLYTDYRGDIEWSLDRPPLYLGHSPGVNSRMTVVENLKWLCQLQGEHCDDQSIDLVLDALGLHGYQETNCSSLSEGQRKRVNLARFFLVNNPCWVMDEPFSSIDVLGFEHLQQRMQEHLSAGGAIILTSHQELTLDAEIRMLELS
ncbi:MAG: cytochrome c biogenesis heme-transporting ATPase CcmA [Gammaproteobacteria bacterium]|jgi:heme exporter protein A|nr:cytochrome c biogenesis heme-transporting ATPase CcmA [Gammaproteobacteria bacterium]MBT4493513.1 cytochrome c biogenesis heme-transporting ATPase CcmA [Gammaproteobacteria bacterium]